MIEATTPTTTESDYIHTIVNAASMEMKDLCEALKASCHFVGLGRIAADYLDVKRFKQMLLRKDEEKLERIKEIVRVREGKPIKILMDVAKVLNDNAGIYDEMEASAKRKAAEAEEAEKRRQEAERKRLEEAAANPGAWELCDERCANYVAGFGCKCKVRIPPALQPRPIPPEECPSFKAKESEA